ncbi:hypothetical protein, partial [Leisingera sp. ANG59]|uniref:hypothetical protein n=1 Tax=Leisingera sp. ANG59 TaxID=2675221 RepID=UPI001C2DD6A9
YFLIVFRDNPVARATDRMLRPSTNTHRRIFDTLSISNTCSFLRTFSADVNENRWVNFTRS